MFTLRLAGEDEKVTAYPYEKRHMESIDEHLQVVEPSGETGDERVGMSENDKESRKDLRQQNPGQILILSHLLGNPQP